MHGDLSEVEQISHKRGTPIQIRAFVSASADQRLLGGGDNATLGTNFVSDPGGTEPCDRHYTSLCVVLVLCKLVNAERQ